MSAEITGFLDNHTISPAAEIADGNEITYHFMGINVLGREQISFARPCLRYCIKQVSIHL
jgi:hypothetical protein